MEVEDTPISAVLVMEIALLGDEDTEELLDRTYRHADKEQQILSYF